MLNENQLIPAVEQAIAGGSCIVQYRDKSDDKVLRLKHAKSLNELCRQHDVVFIINDDVALAKTANADGVHLGRDDPHIDVAREQLGDSAIIGVSCYNELDRAREANKQGADYLAFGSFYSSTTKPNAVRSTPELLHLAKQELDLPIVAIGGITPDNGAELVAAGADALAVITGIFCVDNIREAAERYARLFD